MQWKKSRIVLNTWQEGDYRITENPEAPAGERFSLTSFSDGADPEFFASLKSAQHSAEMRNEMELLRAENMRLRDELNMQRDADAFLRSATKAAPVELPAVAAIAADLVKAMDRQPPERNGTAPHPADDGEYPF